MEGAVHESLGLGTALDVPGWCFLGKQVVFQYKSDQLPLALTATSNTPPASPA